jgi:hypothetical protein
MILKRLFLALVILLVDIAVFFIPLVACFATYILLWRPIWFKDWVDQLYKDCIPKGPEDQAESSA